MSILSFLEMYRYLRATTFWENEVKIVASQEPFFSFRGVAKALHQRAREMHCLMSFQYYQRVLKISKQFVSRQSVLC